MSREVERLLEAWRNEGPEPRLHRLYKRDLQRAWPTLYNALQALDAANGKPVWGSYQGVEDEPVDDITDEELMEALITGFQASIRGSIRPVEQPRCKRPNVIGRWIGRRP